ncbi:MAG TPA: hypothetical protein VGC41_18205 [Kofleriaceae bacterium]
MKALLASLLLCAPALADPTPPPAIQYSFKLAVDGGKGQRQYVVHLVDKACGQVDQNKDSKHDEVKLCAYAEGSKVRLHVEWKLIENDRQVQNTSELLLATKDSSVLDGGSAMLSVTML